MEKSLKGTRTEKNLGISFAGESQARMRYTYFASAAKKEGYEHPGCKLRQRDKDPQGQGLHKDNRKKR